MAYGVWCEVVCADCSCHGYGAWTYKQGVPRNLIKFELKVKRWKQRGDDWLCRDCAKDDEKNKPAIGG